MQLTIVASTRLHRTELSRLTGGRWTVTEPGNDGAFLAEFAGRMCYESWGKPNPATATLEGYLDNIFDQGHLSVIEHGTVSIHFGGVSRSLTHELIRHRHFSFSQLSQRYTRPDAGAFVEPLLLEGDELAQRILVAAWKNALVSYELLLPVAQDAAAAAGFTGTMLRKRAQEAARAVLANMTPTNILVSGNHRSWFEFLLKRGNEHADMEIREAAFDVLSLLQDLEPALYNRLSVEGSSEVDARIVCR